MKPLSQGELFASIPRCAVCKRATITCLYIFVMFVCVTSISCVCVCVCVYASVCRERKRGSVSASSFSKSLQVGSTNSSAVYDVVHLACIHHACHWWFHQLGFWFFSVCLALLSALCVSLTLLLLSYLTTPMSGFIFARFLLWEVIPTSLVLFHFRKQPVPPPLRCFGHLPRLAHWDIHRRDNFTIPKFFDLSRVVVRDHTLPAEDTLIHHESLCKQQEHSGWARLHVFIFFYFVCCC